jgi:glycosyltransferase involved in cell wall biosynthesis
LSIRSTIDVEYEIIIVDDGSDKPLTLDGEKIVRHDHNKGVGAAFDTGVKEAMFDNLFLMGCDIRFDKNQWASQMIKEIEANPTAFTCTSCVALRADRMDIRERRNHNVVTGATILLFHDHQSNVSKNGSFKEIIEAQWLKRLKDRNVDSFEIPCILGAFYGVSKTWYEWVDGFALHRYWGTLEPYISLKSWMFGGSCRVAPRIETGHIFKSSGTHGTTQHALIYNKLLVANLLFKNSAMLVNFIGKRHTVELAENLYKENRVAIEAKKREYADKIVVNAERVCDMLKIDKRNYRET